MNEWESCRIKDFGKVVTGKTPPTSDKEFFEKGYKFDALLIDPHAPGTNRPSCALESTTEDLFQAIVYHCARVNIRKVWVDGIARFSANNSTG